MHECAWENGPGRRMEIRRWLFNPFYYVAGAKALVIGPLFLVATGILGFLGGARFDGILDFHVQL